MGNTSGLAIASLVLGILSLFLWFIPFIGQILPIAAIVFGAVGLHKIKLDNTLTGKGMAIAGIIIGVVSLIISILAILSAAMFVNMLMNSNITQNVTQ